MNENADKYLDNITKKVIKDAHLESPSFNFTASVMSQVKEHRSMTVYKPLISKTGWVVISVVFLTLMACMFFGIQEKSISWFGSLDLSLLSNNKVVNLISGFSVPNTLTYAIVLFGLMLCVQVFFLKNHFNRRLQN
ncbi:hypothetical protein [Flavivirga sp. 57AJ16]|uniref:hypothetical protein n=1 Tax=Flavivirga sp. 57AJ16 TaxID=3025307 RepID=UPI00236706D4|nr:hypothetical protein [Flavivirga sp. 57AJ16]MDD7885230.1 hypothetical protein [Flavivirga sp. 57AJ16]